MTYVYTNTVCHPSILSSSSASVLRKIGDINRYIINYEILCNVVDEQIDKTRIQSDNYLPIIIVIHALQKCCSRVCIRIVMDGHNIIDYNTFIKTYCENHPHILRISNIIADGIEFENGTMIKLIDVAEL